jgi:uncharacterized membrane protein YfcA
MAFLLGFLIAFAIGVTGVGAGTVTAPLLILALGLPPEVAVGTALLFGFLVKVPAGAVYLLRGQVAPWPLLRLLLGGVPGVVLGSLLLALASGGVLGALTGALLATRLPREPLRVALLLWLLFIGGQLVYRGVAHG